MNFFRILIVFSFALPVLQASNPKGVIIYKDPPNGSDDVARVAEYLSYEKFSRVVHYTPANGGALIRTNASGLVGIIEYPDLQLGTIVTQAQIQEFEVVIAQLTDILTKYALARGVMDDDLARFKAALQVFDQGNVLVSGAWKSKSEYEESLKQEQKGLPELTIGDRIYENLKVTSIVGSKISFMHSGGVGSADLSQLTDKQIERLNTTLPSNLMIKRDQLMSAVEDSGQGGETDGNVEDKSGKWGSDSSPEFFTVSLDKKLSFLTDSFATKIAKLEKNLEEAKAALPEGVEYRDLLEAMGRETSFLVKRKLDPVDFGYVSPLQSVDFELYEIVTNPDYNPALGLLETTFTSFESGGMASLPVERLAPAKVTMKDGFDKEVNVFRELPKSEFDMDRLKPFDRVREAEKELEELFENSEMTQKAMRAADLEMNGKIFPPRTYISSNLRRLGFTIQVGKIHLPEELIYESMIEDLRHRNYDKLFEKYTANKKSIFFNEKSYVNMVKDIADTESVIGLIAPNFRASEEVTFGNLPRSFTNTSASISDLIVKVVTLSKTNNNSSSGSGFRSLGLSCSVTTQEQLDLHPDGNGFLVKYDPFESELYIFQSVRSGWQDEALKDRDIEEVVKKLQKTMGGEADNLSKKVRLGTLAEDDLKRGRERLETEFRRQLQAALNSF